MIFEEIARGLEFYANSSPKLTKILKMHLGPEKKGFDKLKEEFSKDHKTEKPILEFKDYNLTQLIENYYNPEPRIIKDPYRRIVKDYYSLKTLISFKERYLDCKAVDDEIEKYKSKLNKAFTDHLKKSNADFNANSIIKSQHIPKDINFFPEANNIGRCFDVIRFWENVLAPAELKDKSGLLHNNDKESTQGQINPKETLKPGINNYFYQRDDYEYYPCLGDFFETRLKLGLKCLASQNSDIKVIVPNQVGPINNILGIDFIVIDSRSGNKKIHFIDSKASPNKDETDIESNYCPSINHFISDRPHHLITHDLKEFLSNREPKKFEKVNQDLIQEILNSFELSLNKYSEEQLSKDNIENYLELSDTDKIRELEHQFVQKLNALRNQFKKSQ
ncbi:MAG: hypothetical protein HRT47_07100 [Candidatus Caenarcaniphilales bacterium]|nr:hypothetical protein [Candidatus Caenarcaniphilales bacterium]